MLTSPRLSRSLMLVAASALIGCGGGGENPAGPSSIEIALSSTTLSLAQGSSSPAIAVTVGRTNFSGEVQLSVEHSVSGVTTTLTSATLAAGQTRSSLSVNVGAAAAAGTASLTVRARGVNVSDKTASLVLTVTVTPAYTLTLPATVQIEPGQSGSVNVALARANFTGAVSLSAEGLPAGATGAFTPNPVTAEASALTVSTGTAAPGTYPVTVRGTAAGLAERVATFALTIATPSYTLTPGSSTLTLPQGHGAAVNVTLVRSNFTGAVAIAVSDLPSGATAAVSPASTTGNAAVLSLNAGSATPGTYALTLRGTAPGLTDRTATISLTLSAPPPGTNVAFNLCATHAPLWVGYQSGAGAWTTMPVSASGAYSFSVAGVGGIAYVIPNGGDGARFGYSTGVIFGSAADLQALGGSACAPAGTKTVNGSVTGLAAGESATIALGDASAAGVTGTFSIAGVTDGTHDLVATRDFVTTSAEGAAKVIIRRGLDPATGTTLPVLDFNAQEAITPVTPTVTVANTGGEQAVAFGAFITGNGTPASLSATDVIGGQAVYRGVPATSLTAGDLHPILTFAFGPVSLRGVQAYFTSAIDRAVPLPPPMLAVSVSTVATSPYARFRIQVPSQSEYGVLLFSEYAQEGSAPAPTDRLVDVVVTSGYFNGLPPTWVAVVPDLTGATGFSATWGLVAGAATTYYAEVDGGSPLTATRANGATATFAATAGNATSSVAAARSRTLVPRRPGAVLPLRRLAVPRGQATMPRR